MKYNKEQFDKGYTEGNYSSAYVSENPAVAWDKLETEHDKESDFYAGFILGFFGSYELHEIPLLYQDEVEHIRNTEAGKRYDD
jgi:hypothetical protein